MSQTPPYRPLLRTQQDLQEAWTRLMGPWGFSGHSLWVMLIGPDDRPHPQLTEVTDTDEPPDQDWEDDVTKLVDMLGGFSEVSRVAFLLSRPGSPAVTERDRGWAAGLYAAGRRAGLACEVVHLATEAGVVPLPMDEVLAEPA